jgi:hypothetical protein
VAGCGGELVAGRTLPLIVRTTDRETGETDTETFNLPVHVEPLTHAYRDMTGLVPVNCDHGLAVHPDPVVMAGWLGRHAKSFVRSKYALASPHDLWGKCVVCRGDPRPDDLTTPMVTVPA